ncbi:MAG: ferric reductase-like transmembrane domain-containing protein [Acidimicrobiales bacterium]
MDTSTIWTSQLWWYLARAGGIVAWVLLAASMIWGLLLSTKLLGRRPHPAWVTDLHRFLGGLSVVFTAVHVAALVLDSYVSFGPAEVLVPFASHWRPAAVAWGVIATYLLVAIEVTSLLRHRLPRRAWRATHLLSFPLFGLGTLHALTAGTDAGTVAWQLVLAMAGATVLGLTAARQVRTRPYDGAGDGLKGGPRDATAAAGGARQAQLARARAVAGSRRRR